MGADAGILPGRTERGPEAHTGGSQAGGSGFDQSARGARSLGVAGDIGRGLCGPRKGGAMKAIIRDYLRRWKWVFILTGILQFPSLFAPHFNLAFSLFTVIYCGS